MRRTAWIRCQAPGAAAANPRLLGAGFSTGVKLILRLRRRVWVRSFLMLRRKGLGGSSRRGVRRTLFEGDVYLIADCGQGLADGAGWNLEHGSGLHANCGNAPGLEVFFDVDDNSFSVEIHGINRKTHGEGVNAVRRTDPEALAACEPGRVGSYQNAKTGPMGACDQQIGREIGGAGAVEGVSLGPGPGHDISSIGFRD